MHDAYPLALNVKAKFAQNGEDFAKYVRIQWQIELEMHRLWRVHDAYQLALKVKTKFA